MTKLAKIEQQIREQVSAEVCCREWRSSIVLEGLVNDWQQVVKAGQIAASKGYKGVVNDIEVKGLKIPPPAEPLLQDSYLGGKKVDLLIIGGGVIGCACARELSRWNISILLIDKEDDVAVHASSRNNGMIHPGLAPQPGLKKAYFNVKGNQLFPEVCKELDVPFKRIGSMLLLDRWFHKLYYPFLKHRARRNGLSGLKLLSVAEVQNKEPAVNKNITGAVFVPDTGIVSPYQLTIAYAENALANGVELSLNTIARSMKLAGNKILSVDTNRGTLFPGMVINAAGVFSDRVAEMAGDRFFTIHPRKGEIIILDKKKGSIINSALAKPVFRSKKTKGGGLVRTVDGNLLIGPSAYEQPFPEDYTTSNQQLEMVINKHFPLVPAIDRKDIITYFAGTRAATYQEDFIIERSDYVDNLIHAAGIQSPGLTSAPAIAREVAKLAIAALQQEMKITIRPGWNPIRKGRPLLNSLSAAERNDYIARNSDYGFIICRCEEISKGEIIDAINSPLAVHSLDAVKRRVRTGMGRCQGGFCLPLLAEIIQQETGLDMLQLTKKGNGSYLLCSETKK